MPKLRIEREVVLTTRTQYTTVDTVLSIALDGKELPTTAIVGEALEKAITDIQAAITKSYEIVPARPSLLSTPVN